MGFVSSEVSGEKKRKGWSTPYTCPRLRDCCNAEDFDQLTKQNKQRKRELEESNESDSASVSPPYRKRRDLGHR